MIALIDKSDKQFIAHFEMFDRTGNWQNKPFYVSKFFSNGVEEF